MRSNFNLLDSCPCTRVTIELMCRIETITDMGHPDSALQKLPRSQLTRLDKLKVWVTPSRIVLGKTIKPTLEYARDVYCRYHEAQARSVGGEESNKTGLPS